MRFGADCGRAKGMRSLVAWALVALLVGCGDDDGVDAPGTDASADATNGPIPFRVLTWNVENLFDETDDPETFDDVPTAAEVTRKLNDLAEVIRSVNPDFVALQEVENEAILQRLADTVPELGYDQVGLVDSFDPRGIDVGFMTRVPLSEIPTVTSHLGEQFPLPDGSDEIYYTRDALEVFVDVGNTQVGVVIVHFRSMRDGGADIREAEATYTARIVEARVSSGLDHMLVVGDLNDVPSSPTLDAILEGPLADLTLDVPIDDRWTFTFSGVRRQLDYILGSPRMEAAVSDVIVLHGRGVDAASDHQPVAADFLVPQ